MDSTYRIDTYITQAKELLNKGVDFKKISEQLSAEGADDFVTDTVIRQLKSVFYLKKRKRGFRLGIAGAAMLIAGFLLTVLFYHSGISIQYVMYGMTSIGAILMVAGLVDITGW